MKQRKPRGNQKPLRQQIHKQRSKFPYVVTTVTEKHKTQDRSKQHGLNDLGRNGIIERPLAKHIAITLHHFIGQIGRPFGYRRRQHQIRQWSGKHLAVSLNKGTNPLPRRDKQPQQGLAKNLGQPILHFIFLQNRGINAFNCQFLTTQRAIRMTFQMFAGHWFFKRRVPDLTHLFAHHSSPVGFYK